MGKTGFGRFRRGSARILRAQKRPPDSTDVLGGSRGRFASEGAVVGDFACGSAVFRCFGKGSPFSLGGSFSRREGIRRTVPAHAQGARRAIAVCGISRKKRPQSMRAVWRIFRLDAQRAVLLNVISDGFQGRYNGFAERKVPRSAPERTLQSPWRNMNLSCIFSRKSSLNFLSPRPRPASEI